GLNGISCIEVGGPEPGIGCAGRGMITAFEKLNKLGFDYNQYDVVLYDVLGDVVCGGFAVPLRKNNANAVYIVTSGEFMSIYAANNIIRGIRNFSDDEPRVAGIILNMRGLENEYNRVSRFSKAVGVPIVSTINRDNRFSESEMACIPIAKMYPDSKPAESIDSIVSNLLSLIEGKGKLYNARPLTDEQLEQLACNNMPITVRSVPSSNKTDRFHLENDRGLLKVCATKGAAVMTVSGINDVEIVIHGPKSCGHMINTAINNHHALNFYEKNQRTMPKNNVHCTCMDEVASIYGGTGLLEELLSRLIDSGKRNFVIITTCMSGMLGDDVERVTGRVKEKIPDVIIIDIPADGVMTGDSVDGRLMAIKKLLEIIDPDVLETEDKITIVDDFCFRFCSDENMQSMNTIFGLMNLKIGLRLFDDCSINDIITAKKNRYTIMARENKNNKSINSLLKEKNIRVYKSPLPRGIRQSDHWIAGFTSKYKIDRTRIDEYIEQTHTKYEMCIEESANHLKSIKIGIFSTTTDNIQWVIDVLTDLGLDIIDRICLSANSVSDNQKTNQSLNFKVDDEKQLFDRVKQWNVDLIIGDMRISKIDHDKMIVIDFEHVFYNPSFELIQKLMTFISNNQPGWKKWNV
ncbi:MAG: nitrogenase component 1, partial [Candidatus Methanomethylophilaceae archaeon]